MKCIKRGPKLEADITYTNCFSASEPPPGKPGLVRVRTKGPEDMARQWPRRPYVPFCYEEGNTKTTRGLGTNKCAAALQRYATVSPRQAGAPGSAVQYHRVRVCGDINGNAETPPCVTFRLVVALLRGPGRSPVLPFACCVGLLLSVLIPALPNQAIAPKQWPGSTLSTCPRISDALSLRPTGHCPGLRPRAARPSVVPPPAPFGRTAATKQSRTGHNGPPQGLRCAHFAVEWR